MDTARIRELREEVELTQQYLASILGITRSAYSNYENGLREVPIDILKKLAAFYDTSIDYLVGQTDVKDPYPHQKSKK